MRITRLHIYGFGKWINHAFDFSDDTIQWITGNNEAGKTTLRQCMLYLLFGQTPKEIEKYMPKQGGKIGGTMTIEGLSDEPIIIERIYKRNKGKAVIYLHNGKIEDEEWLRSKLNHIDRSFYEAIFSFDVMDLQKIQQMDVDTLNEVLLAIGMTGTDRIYFAEKELDKQKQALFKPNGTKPMMNQLFAELDELNIAYRKALDEEKTYAFQLSNKDTIEQQLEANNHTINQKEKTYNQVKLLLTHYTTIESLYMKTQQYNRIDAKATFPTDGIERLDYIKEKMLPIQSEAEVVKKKKATLDEQIKRLSSELLEESTISKMEVEMEAYESMHDKERELHQLKQQAEQEKRQIELQLHQLHISLSFEQLDTIDFSFQTEEEWNMLSKQSEQYNMEKQYVNEEYRAMTTLIHELEEEVREKEVLVASTYEIEKAKEEIDNVSKQKSMQQMNKRQKQLMNQLKKIPLLSIPILLIAFYLFVINQVQWGIVIAMIGILPSLFVFVLIKLITPVQVTYQAENIDSTEQLQETQIWIEEQERMIARIEQIDQLIKQHKIEQLKLSERMQFIDMKRNQIEEKIRDQINHYPFLQTIDLSYWVNLYHKLSRIMEQYESYLRNTNQIKGMEEEITSWKKKHKEMITSFQVDSIEQLRSLTQANKENKDKLALLKQDRDVLTEELALLKQKKKPYMDEMTQLLQEQNVASEEAFRKSGEDYRIRTKLLEETNQLIDSLKVSFTTKEIKSFQDGHYQGKALLSDSLQKLEQDIRLLKESHVHLQEQLNEVHATIIQLEKLENVSDLHQKIQFKKDELATYAKEWAICHIASETIAQTKSTFIAQHIPDLLDKASKYFNQLTNNMYTHIIFKEENQWIYVQNNQHMLFALEELSQGTRDQLYISLRLALSDLFTNTKLPFFIDDSFVHFDSTRKEVMMELLREKSKTNQLFYFTTSTEPAYQSVITL